jgi:hypothetical protein
MSPTALALLVALLLGSVRSLEVETLDIPYSLNRSVSVGKSSILLLNFSAAPLQSFKDVFSFHTLSRLFSSIKLELNATGCAVYTFEGKTCDEVLSAAKAATESSLSWVRAFIYVEIISIQVLASWSSDLITFKLTPFEPKCVGVLSRGACSLPVAVKTTGLCVFDLFWLNCRQRSLLARAVPSGRGSDLCGSQVVAECGLLLCIWLTLWDVAHHWSCLHVLHASNAESDDHAWVSLLCHSVAFSMASLPPTHRGSPC